MLSLSFVSAAQDTAHVYFALGSSTLSIQAKHTIDSLFYNDVLSAQSKAGIIGYADNLGEQENNMTLSVARAKAVSQYLLSLHMNSGNIESVTGRGEVNRKEQAGGYPADRRVDIIPGGFVDRKINNSAVTTAKRKIDISKIVVNGVVRLENLYFIKGTAVLQPASNATLEMLYDVMHDNPTLRIRIEGHVCCNSVDAEKGKKLWVMDSVTHEPVSVDAPMYSGPNLSENRAKAVYEYLIRHGIASSRLGYIGFGSRRMIVNPEKNEADRDKNRRVEIRILEK